MPLLKLNFNQFVGGAEGACFVDLLLGFVSLYTYHHYSLQYYISYTYSTYILYSTLLYYIYNGIQYYHLHVCCTNLSLYAQTLK